LFILGFILGFRFDFFCVDGVGDCYVLRGYLHLHLMGWVTLLLSNQVPGATDSGSGSANVALATRIVIEGNGGKPE
jgi:hypothetical protein